MQTKGISREEVLMAFRSKNTESTNIPGAVQGIVHLPGRGKDVGAIYKKNDRGQWVIITCWSRKRY